MRRLAIRGRSLLLIAAAGLGTLGSGCSHGTPIPPVTIRMPKVTAESEMEVQGGASATLGGIEGGGIGHTLKLRQTPALPRDIETLSDSELVVYLDSLEYDLDPFNNEVVNAACDHALSGAPCVAPDSARVFIQPEIGAHLWKHTTIPAHGLVIARILNYDITDRTEHEFRFPANTKVWWVVDYDANHRLRSRYFRRNYSATAPAVVPVGVTRGFEYCKHAHSPNHSEAQAKFVSCSQSLASTVPKREEADGRRVSAAAADNPVIHAAAFRSVVPLAPRPTVMALTSTWVTCGSGCCATSP